MIAVNLLASERVAASRRRARRRAWFGVLFGQASVVGLALLVAAQIHTPHESPAQLIAKLQVQQGEKDREKQAIAAEMSGLRGRMELSNLVTNHPRWGSLLSIIAKAKGPEAVLERVEVGSRVASGDAGGALRSSYTVGVTGYAASREGVAQIVSRLEATKVFDTVTPVETRATVYGPTGAEVVSFSLTLSLSEGGKAK
ncbi:MAG: hypothetical protein WC718_13785 [Phycisphaerales bacterium]|jgi:Tfp pilus assembly protein PilN